MGWGGENRVQIGGYNVSVPAGVEGNSLSLSAAPSRGSHVLRDSCSREILSATGLFSSRATLTVRLKGSLARELAPQRLRELPSAAAQPERCSKTKGVAFGRSATGTLQQNQRSCLRPQCNRNIAAKPKELPSAAVQPKHCSKTKGVAFGRSTFPCCGFIRGRGKPNTQLICNQLAGGLSAADAPPAPPAFCEFGRGGVRPAQPSFLIICCRTSLRWRTRSLSRFCDSWTWRFSPAAWHRTCLRPAADRPSRDPSTTTGTPRCSA